MKLKLFMPTTSIAGGLFMLKRTIKKDPAGPDPWIPHRAGLHLIQTRP